MRLTLEQHRVQRAYVTTRGAIEYGVSKKSWSTVVMPFGTHVQREGLVQALAFLARRATEPDLKAAREAFVVALQAHLLERGFVCGNPADASTLVQAVAAIDAQEYMFVTREVIAISIWFKRAAQALCE